MAAQIASRPRPALSPGWRDDRDHIGRRLRRIEVADYGWGKGSYRVAYFAAGSLKVCCNTERLDGFGKSRGPLRCRDDARVPDLESDPKERIFAERCLQAGREVYEMGWPMKVSSKAILIRPLIATRTTWADDMEWERRSFSRD